MYTDVFSVDKDVMIQWRLFLCIGGYSDMDGLQLTCEFNKKGKKMKIVAATVFAVLYCPENVLFLLLLSWKKKGTLLL